MQMTFIVACTALALAALGIWGLVDLLSECLEIDADADPS